MQQNINPCNQNPIQHAPSNVGPNAVNINIFQPQAYGSTQGLNSQVQGCYSQGACTPIQGYYPQNVSGIMPQNYYPLYQTNQNPNLPLYPMNYNNMVHQPNEAYPNSSAPQQDKNNSNSTNAYKETNLINKTSNPIEEETPTKTNDKEKDKKPKEITILTDDYIKSLENYLNDSNPKVRLIAAKEVMERFKEDDERITNPSLSALLNKMLRDTSPSVRFLGLTTLQLGYSIGNDETIEILKEIQANNQDKLTQDSLLASEILLKLSAPKIKEVK